MSDYTTQPIDTAPTDGRKILLYVPAENSGDPEIYGWFSGFFNDGAWWTRVWEIDAADYSPPAGEHHATGCHPTHWAPLPPEPGQ